MYVLGLFEGSFGHFNAYLVVFELFLTKTEEKYQNVDKGRGGGQTMWIRIFVCFRPF